MKKVYLLFLFAFVASFGTFAQNSGEVKGVDNMDYIVANKADATSGSIDGTDPIYHRSFGNGYSGNCDWANNGSRDVNYDVYPIYTTTSEALDISTTQTGGSTSDGHMTLFCDPFDPANPTLNVVAIDDDDGPGFMPAFLPADNYMVDANTQYYLVVTTFGDGATMDYDLTLGGNFTIGSPAPPPAVPLSNWAFALIGLFTVSFVFFKFRK